MDDRKRIFSFFGIGFGAVALLLAVIHFWAGPFTPKPTFEKTIASKVVSIKDAALAKLKGEEPPIAIQQTPSFDIDKVVNLAIPVLGALALILAVVAFATNEPPKAAIGAAILGAGSIAFQFAITALVAIILVFLIVAVVGNLDIS